MQLDKVVNLFRDRAPDDVLAGKEGVAKVRARREP